MSAGYGGLSVDRIWWRIQLAVNFSVDFRCVKIEWRIQLSDTPWSSNCGGGKKND